MAKINIIDAYKKIKLPIKKLRGLVKQIILEEKLNFTEVNIIFVDDGVIHSINKQFLNHDYPTDVISFDLSDELTIEGRIAEVYISIDTAIYQSGIYGVSLENELARLTAHGLLHLTGYDDKQRKEKLRMRARENYYIGKIGV